MKKIIRVMSVVTVCGTIFMMTGWVLAQDAGAVAWWKFEENNGAIANDSVGNLPGMITGTKWAKGKFGGALKFTLPGDCVDVLDNSILSPKEEITIELWVLIQKYNGSENNIILKPGSYGIDLADGKIRFKVYIKRDWAVCSANIIDTGTWHHVAGTYSASDGLLALYADGIVLNTMTYQISACNCHNTDQNQYPYNIDASEDDLYIGGTTEIPSICGLIDEIKIYNRRLTDKEIMKHAEWR
jgi:hypothetical protein